MKEFKDFIVETGLFKYLFSLFIIINLGSLVPSIVSSIKDYFNKPNCDKVKVVELKCIKDLEYFSATVLDEPIKFDEIFTYKQKFVSEMVYKTSYLTEVESNNGRFYIITQTDNIQVGNKFEGYFIRLDWGTFQSNKDVDLYLNILVPIFNTDLKNF